LRNSGRLGSVPELFVEFAERAGEAGLAGDSEHFRLEALHFGFADFVDLFGAGVGGGLPANENGVVLAATRQAAQTDVGPRFGRVGGLEECEELLPRGQEFFFVSRDGFVVQLFLLIGRDIRRETAKRGEQGRRRRILRGLRLNLLDHEVDDDARLREAAGNRFVKQVDILIDVRGKAVEPRENVFVVANGAPRHAVDGDVGGVVQAEDLRDAEQMHFQIFGVQLQAQVIFQQAEAHLVGIGQAVG
jgi:hypothetical protein